MAEKKCANEAEVFELLFTAVEQRPAPSTNSVKTVLENYESGRRLNPSRLLLAWRAMEMLYRLKDLPQYAKTVAHHKQLCLKLNEIAGITRAPGEFHLKSPPLWLQEI